MTRKIFTDLTETCEEVISRKIDSTGTYTGEIFEAGFGYLQVDGKFYRYEFNYQIQITLMIVFTFSEFVEADLDEILDAMNEAMARGELPPDAFEKMKESFQK